MTDPRDVLKTRRIDLLPVRNPRGRRPASHAAADASEPPLPFDFRVLFENAYDGMLVADEAGCVIASNRRAESFFREGGSWLKGSMLQQLVPGLTDELLRSVSTTAAVGRFSLLQAWCRRADGALFPAEVVITGSVQSGRCRLFVQIRDATIRRNAEERLLSITRALDTAAVGIGTADLDGSISYVNSYLVAKLGASSADALLGRPLSELLGQGRPDLCGRMIEAIRSSRVWSGEVSLMVDGEVLWLQVDAAPHQDSEGMLVGLVFSMRDIGDSKRAEAAEYRASRHRLMAESMAAACHLLGQPATILLTSLEVIRSRKEPDPEADAALYEAVFEAAREMRELLERMQAQALDRQSEGAGAGRALPAERGRQRVMPPTAAP